MSSRNQPISTTIQTISLISRDEHAMLWTIINKARMLNGWTTKPADELDATIRTWFEVFTEYRIPIVPDVLNKLYLKAFDTRQEKLRKGDEVPQCDATLLVSGWTGEHGLRSEIEKARIAEKKYLPETAESVCPRCFGASSKLEIVYDDQGHSLGSRICDHRALVEGEWLWKKAQKAKTVQTV